LPAYWIDPNNRYSEIRDNHIISIITNPAAFGTSKEVVEDTYLKFNERVGSEGVARRELIDAAINRGWIRVRIYPKTHCSITIAEMDDRVQNTITEFMMNLVDGKLGVGHTDTLMPVKFAVIKSEAVATNYTIKEIYDGILLNGKKLVQGLEHIKVF